MTLEEIVSYRNLEQACDQVTRNKGVGGVDEMQTDELRDFLLTNYAEIAKQILNESYVPQAVKKVEIPKADGGKRMLGIPTVIDRMVQQAISQRLSQEYELGFSEHSYGFRPARNSHQAVQQAQKFLDEGCTFVVELDLEKFFDTVNHDRLISVLSWKVKDQRILRLIRKYLRSGIMSDGIVSQRSEGTPQGSPLSPLLSNIILDELDRELESRAHKFVRYADDVSIYKKSNKSAERTLASITDYIEQKLLLKVNRTKSKISRPTGSKLLGFSFYKTKSMWRIRVAKSSINRLKLKLKSISNRNNGKNFKRKLQELKPVMTGWVSYFRLADAQGVMKELDGMLRTRLRMGLWKEWKNCKTRVRNLRKLGIGKQKSYEWGNTSRGYCRVAHSPILCRSLDNDYFRSQGYAGFWDTYERKTKLPIPFS